MKYRIMGASSPGNSKKTAVKWLIYAAALVFSYALLRSGAFGFWQPVFLVPLPIAVAMREQELPACVFSLFCGLYIDCAFGFIFGFSAFWLILVCLVVSLLSRNLVQPNLLNFCWLTACAVLLEFSMDYLFNVAVWDVPHGEVLLLSSILPTAAATFLLSPPVYFLVKAVDRKFGASSSAERYEPPEEEADESDE